jgi:alpha-L-arabinofuranosidase
VKAGRLAVNLSIGEPTTLAISLEGFGAASVVEVAMLCDDDVRAENTAEWPSRVTPAAGTASVDAKTLTPVLPPVS